MSKQEHSLTTGAEISQRISSKRRRELEREQREQVQQLLQRRKVLTAGGAIGLSLLTGGSIILGHHKDVQQLQTAPERSSSEIHQYLHNASARESVDPQLSQEWFSQVFVNKTTEQKRDLLLTLMRKTLTPNIQKAITTYDSMKDIISFDVLDNLDQQKKTADISAITSAKVAIDGTIHYSVGASNTYWKKFLTPTPIAVTLSHEAFHLREMETYFISLDSEATRTNSQITIQQKIEKNLQRENDPKTIIMVEAQAYATQSETLIELIGLGDHTVMGTELEHIAAVYLDTGRDASSHKWKQYIAQYLDLNPALASIPFTKRNIVDFMKQPLKSTPSAL